MSTQVQLTTPESGATAPVETPVVDPNRHEWLPKEFATVEAYNASYAELRADHTRKSQELARLRGETVETPAETTSEEPKTETPKTAPVTPPKIEEPKKDDEANPDDPANKVIEASGFDVNPYQEEYFSTGDVTPENRAKIAEGLKGVLGDNALEIVNQYIEGQKVTHANDRKMYYEEAGGEDAYHGLVTWASTNLSKEEIAAYNKAIDSGDRHAATLAIRGLRSTYEAKNGRDPNRIIGSGGANGPSSGAPFQSSAEMTAAMRDPRYKTDEAYRANVAARIAASSNL